MGGIIESSRARVSNHLAAIEGAFSNPNIMANTTAKVHITKLAAAQRQLRAAVRIFFSGEDELAVHTVASAAYRLLQDLKAYRGRDEVGDYYLTKIFYCVREYLRGKLPSYLANDPETMNWIRKLADEIPIDSDSKFTDFSASVSPSMAKEFWQKRNVVSNFLKHADHDPTAAISLDQIDNLQLLMQTYSAYVDLVHDELEAEGFVLWLYYNVASGVIEGLPSQYKDTAEKLALLKSAERLRFCSLLIRELNEPT